MKRAIFEFSYPIPSELLNFNLAGLDQYRQDFAPVRTQLAEFLQESIQVLEQADSNTAATSALKQIHQKHRQFQQNAKEILEQKKAPYMQNYLQYHWYPTEKQPDNADIPAKP